MLQSGQSTWKDAAVTWAQSAFSWNSTPKYTGECSWKDSDIQWSQALFPWGIQVVVPPVTSTKAPPPWINRSVMFRGL